MDANTGVAALLPQHTPSTCLRRRAGNLRMLVLDPKSKINGKLNKLLFKRNLLQAFKGPLFPLLDKQHHAHASADIGLLIKNVVLEVQTAPSPGGIQGSEPLQIIISSRLWRFQGRRRCCFIFRAVGVLASLHCLGLTCPISL